MNNDNNRISSASQVARTAYNFVSKRLDEVKNWAGHAIKRESQPYTGQSAKVDSLHQKNQATRAAGAPAPGVSPPPSPPRPAAPNSSNIPSQKPFPAQASNVGQPKMNFPEDLPKFSEFQKSYLDSMPPDVKTTVENRLNGKTQAGGQSSLDVLRIVEKEYAQAQSNSFSKDDLFKNIETKLKEYAGKPGNELSRPAVDSALSLIRSGFKTAQATKGMDDAVRMLNDKIKANLGAMGNASLASEVKYENGSLTCKFIVKHSTENESRTVAELGVKNALDQMGMGSVKVESSLRGMSGATAVTCSFDPYVVRGLVERSPSSNQDILNGLNEKTPDMQWKISDNNFVSEPVVPAVGFKAGEISMKKYLQDKLGKGSELVSVIGSSRGMPEGQVKVFCSISPEKARAIVENNLL